MTNRGNELSAADRQALDVLITCNLQLQESLKELARIIAAERGLGLDAPQPAGNLGQPRSRARHRLAHVERPERGVAVADVLNERTGEVRRFRFTRADDGIDVEEE